MPDRPEPLTPRAARVRRDSQKAIIAASQQAGLLPRTVAPLSLPVVTGTKRFHLHQVARVPVEMTPAAREAIMLSTQQGRIFPQALAETFGALGTVRRVTIDLVPKARHFPLHPSEGEPLLLEIMVEHAGHPVIPLYRWHINASDLIQLHPATKEPLFQAAGTAQELARLYPHARTPVPVALPATRARNTKGS